MDRAEYYRILGVQPGASRAQIDQAYNERLKRLKSTDYADEQAYADRKLRELKYAYSVVAGGAAPASERKKLEHHERKKDDMEIAETADGFLGNLGGQMKAAAERFRESAESAVRHPEGSHSHKNDRSGSQAQDSGRDRDDWQREMSDTEGARKRILPLVKVKGFDGPVDGNRVRKTIVGAIVALLAFVPTLISSCESDRYPDIDFGGAEYDEATAYEDTVRAVNQLLYDKVSDYDYDGWLDYDDAESYLDQITYDLVLQEGEDTHHYTNALAMHLGIGSASDALSYLTALTGSERLDDYYWEHTDAECTMMLAEQLMDAPAFDAAAGAVSLYTGERILTMEDYLQFLVDVANSQTFSVLYG